MSPIERSEVPVVILCGGKGTRLREETEYRPKPMVEIGPQPILWHIMKIYRGHGLRRFLLCLGYKGWEIKQFFLRYREMHADFTLDMANHGGLDFHDGGNNGDGNEDWKITCAETGPETATGARLWLVRKYLQAETFCFTYGDAVGDVDIDALLQFHWDQGRIATVTGVHPTSRYGEMKADGGKVLEFDEKPTHAEGLVSGGFFVFERRVFDYLNDDPQLFLEQQPLQRLARDGELSVYRHDGFWHPMDTYRDYLYLNELWKRGETPWRSW